MDLLLSMAYLLPKLESVKKAKVYCVGNGLTPKYVS